MARVLRSRLSVNVNAVAMLRNRRDLPWPSVTGLARIAMESGAKGITVHPRPDERHIRASDIGDLSALFAGAFPDRELCLEGYPDERFLDLVRSYHPHQVLLVPDSPEQPTSDHGWTFGSETERLTRVCGDISALGIRVALFVDPDPSLPAKAAACGAGAVEIYTGPYGACYDDKDRARDCLDAIVACAESARDCGLGVHAGHDLTLDNLPALIARIPFVREVSIGHGFTADALIYGFESTVKRYRQALDEV